MASTSEKPTPLLLRDVTSSSAADVVQGWTSDPSVGDQIRHRGTATSVGDLIGPVVTQTSAAAAAAKGSHGI